VALIGIERAVVGAVGVPVAARVPAVLASVAKLVYMETIILVRCEADDLALNS